MATTLTGQCVKWMVHFGIHSSQLFFLPNLTRNEIHLTIYSRRFLCHQWGDHLTCTIVFRSSVSHHTQIINKHCSRFTLHNNSSCLYDQSPHGLPLRHSGSPKFAVKTRQAFYLQTTGLTRIARRLCQDIIRPRYLARHPYLPVNTAAIKAECKSFFLILICLFKEAVLLFVTGLSTPLCA